MSKLIALSVLVVVLAAGSVYFVPSLREHQSLKTLASHPVAIAVQEYSVIALDYLKHLSSQALTALTKKYPPEPRCTPRSERLFTPESLKAYDGSSPNGQVYLAFLGIVYDVTKGRKHYAPGGTYAAFAGKDASRAFVTGEFKEGTSGLLDDITDLGTSSFTGIKDWASFYNKEYTRIGRVVGTYYDSEGCPTSAIKIIQDKYDQLEKEAESQKQMDIQYPPCNNEWSQESQTTRFWCTNLSGGVKRDWVGLPKKMFFPGTQESRCACIKSPAERDAEEAKKKKSGKEEPGILYEEEENPLVQDYEGCHTQSVQCFVKDAWTVSSVFSRALLTSLFYTRISSPNCFTSSSLLL